MIVPEIGAHTHKEVLSSFFFFFFGTQRNATRVYVVLTDAVTCSLQTSFVSSTEVKCRVTCIWRDRDTFVKFRGGYVPLLV